MTTDVEEEKTNRLKIRIKALLSFFAGTADSVIKLVVTVAVLGLKVQQPTILPAWAVVSIVLGVYAIGLFGTVYIQTAWFTIDMRNNKKRDDDGVQPDPPETPKTP